MHARLCAELCTTPERPMVGWFGLAGASVFWPLRPCGVLVTVTHSRKHKLRAALTSIRTFLVRRNIHLYMYKVQKYT